MVSKEVIAFSIIGFWLFLPIPLMIMGVGGFSDITKEDYTITQESSFITGFENLADGLGLYFKLLVFNIPNANGYILRFVNFIQILSVLFILIMIRGN